MTSTLSRALLLCPTPLPARAPRLLTAALALTLVACGGGGGGPGAPGPVAPPTVAIVFPHVAGLTAAATLTVRGTASSAVGVAGVSVGGTQAQSLDGFATWTVLVPLALGTNQLDVSVTDAQATTAGGPTLQIERVGALVSELVDLAYDPATERVYVADFGGHALVELDQVAQQARVVSGGSVGSGPSLGAPRAIALDAAGERVFVSQTELLSVSLLTGERTLVSGAAVGNGPALVQPPSLAYHPVTKVLYALDAPSDALFVVDVGSGDRTVLSGNGAGSGPAFGNVSDLALDVANGLAFVVCTSPNEGLYAVDLASGARTLVSGAGVGTGPGFVTPRDVVYDAANNSCYCSQNSFPASVLAVDPLTGDRKLVPLGNTPTLQSSPVLVVDPVKGRVLVGDTLAARMRSFDPVTGATQELWMPGRGSGHQPVDVEGVALLPGGSHAALGGYYEGSALTIVELATGNRSLLSGSGRAMQGVSALILDPPNARLLVAAYHGTSWSVLAVDPASGDRTLLSGDGAGTGPNVDYPSTLALDPVAQRAYLGDAITPSVLAIDLASGDRSVFTGLGVGNGPALDLVRGLGWDAAGGRVLLGAVTASGQVLLAADALTGNRTELASATLGTGPNGWMLQCLLPDPAGGPMLGTGFVDVLAFNLASGDRVQVASNGVGTGPLLTLSSDELAASPVPGVVLLHDDTTNMLLLVDTVTGDRIVLSL